MAIFEDPGDGLSRPTACGRFAYGRITCGRFTHEWIGRRVRLAALILGAGVSFGLPAMAEAPPRAQSALLPPGALEKVAPRKGIRNNLAAPIPPGLKDGRCRPEMFKPSKVAGLANAARRSLSPPRRKGGGQRAEPMDGTALGALMAAVSPRNKVRVLARRETICFSQSFEYIPDRKTVAWSNTKVAVYYSVMPLRTLRTNDGHVCREYTAKATVNGHAADVYGTACRDSDGRWLLID